MATILTKPFGSVELDERQRIRFPFGVLGFESLHDYALLDADQAPFYWLQSLEVVEIAFVLIEPRVFRARLLARRSPRRTWRKSAS